MSARRRIAATLAVAAVALGLTGCGSSPNPTFYALAPTAGTPQPAALHTVKVRRLAIPGYLDRPEIVRNVVDYRLGVAQFERWGEPLDAMLGRVLAEDIEQRLDRTSVYIEGGALSADPDAIVEIELRRFDVGPKGDVRLSAEIQVERTKAGAAATQAVTLQATPADGSTSALVATMSALIGQLSDRIAAMLRAAG